VNQADYIVATDARRKEIYWARYKDGARIEGPSVSKPDEVNGFIADHFPDMAKMVSLASTQNITEPFYLRRPDAVPTAERR
jgi:tRNA A37 threonylcarbamoyladenosine modification protein TsaB